MFSTIQPKLAIVMFIVEYCITYEVLVVCHMLIFGMGLADIFKSVKSVSKLEK